MSDQKKFVVSHAPFCHDGSSITERNMHTMLAALPALLLGMAHYGLPALAVASFSVGSAMLWELAVNFLRKQDPTIGDGHAAMIGLLFAMMIPAATPWWVVLTGTFVCVVIGKAIFGGIGGNCVNPVLLGLAILTVSWKDYFDVDLALQNYDLGFADISPLIALKYLGVSAVADLGFGDLLLGRQLGPLGSTFGLGLILGGVYLIARGIIRWEISLSFLAGIIGTAIIFNLADASRFAGPGIHLLAGYTLIGAFFLATEDASSPVNFIPMLLYGAGGGILTVLIRNIGAYPDGIVLAILIMNLVSPLLDKIKPKAMGKVE